MVKAILFFILVSFQLLAQEVIVTSEMNYTELFAGKPLTGTITITHDKTKQVDVSSFKLGSEILKTSFLNNVVISENSPLIISIYSFELPSKPKGLHVLPEVSVRVGGKLFKSYSRSYEVFGDNSTNTPSINIAPTAPKQVLQNQAVPQPDKNVIPASTNGETAVLKLETIIDGPTKLYPGQQIKFTYRFFYKGHIDLSKEELPLLDGKGLTKIGDKQVRDFEENNLSVFESSQLFEAKEPGIYQFGPSILEGLAYNVGPNGTKTLSQTPLHSETPPVLIEVMPFPASLRPASFNGAVGQFSFKATLNSSPTLNVGEKLTLLLEMTGDPAYLTTVKAPDLCCQPGFPGNFKPSDLPPISTISNGTKSFLVDLIPLSSNVSKIPAIEFASFDLAQNKYLTVKSAPIAITVISKPTTSLNTSQDNAEILTPQSANTPQPIQILSHEDLTKSDLQNKVTGSWWNFLWIPALGGLLYLQYKIRKEWDEKKPAVKKVPSLEIFKIALNQNPGSPEFYKYLQEALITALEEKGEIPTANIEAHELPKTGLSHEVRLFLAKLDELKFSGKMQFNQSIIASAKELYQKITGN